MRLSLAGLTLLLFILAACGRSDDAPAVVPVVVANEAIPADTVITADMLKVVYVSPNEADAQAFTSRSHVTDRVSAEDITAGAMIVLSMVRYAAADPMPWRLPFRGAVAIEVDAQLPAGMSPGDMVDVVGVFVAKDFESANRILETLGKLPLEDEPSRATGETGNRSLILTVTIYPNLRLLGVGQSLEVDTERRPTTVALRGTAQQREKIAWADHYGSLRLKQSSLTLALMSPPTLTYIGELR